MRLSLRLGFILFASAAVRVNGQSIDNRDWKAFIAEPINDTLTLHVQGDSSYVANSRGEIMIRTTFTIVRDTLTILDNGTNDHECPNTKGKYKIDLNDDTLVLKVIDDECEGRAKAIDGVRWKAVQKK